MTTNMTKDDVIADAFAHVRYHLTLPATGSIPESSAGYVTVAVVIDGATITTYRWNGADPEPNIIERIGVSMDENPGGEIGAVHYLTTLAGPKAGAGGTPMFSTVLEAVALGKPLDLAGPWEAEMMAAAYRAGMEYWEDAT
jgi:hypothetical protein